MDIDWNAVKTWLIGNKEWIVVAIALSGLAFTLWDRLTSGLGKIGRLIFGKKPEPEAKEPADAIVDKLLIERDARREAEQERDQLKKAVEALQDQTGPKRDDALAALKNQETDKAEALFQEIAEEKELAGSEANKQAAEAWRHIGALAFLHDTEKALRAYAKSTELDPDDPDGWNQLGHLQMRVGNLDAAEKSFKKVLSLGNRSIDKAVIAAATGNLGLIHRTRGDLDTAEEMHLKSLEIETELGCKEGMASVYGNLGLIHRTRDDLDTAEEMHRKALEINQDLGRKEGMANQYGNLGLIHGRRGDLEKAEEMLRKSLEIHKDLGHKEGMASVYGNLGLIHGRRGDLEKAEEMLRKSLEINQDLGRKEGMASDYGNLGVVEKERGNTKKACDFLRRARDLFAEIGMAPEVEKTNRLMTEAGCEGIDKSGGAD